VRGAGEGAAHGGSGRQAAPAARQWLAFWLYYTQASSGASATSHAPQSTAGAATDTAPVCPLDPVAMALRSHERGAWSSHWIAHAQRSCKGTAEPRWRLGVLQSRHPTTLRRERL